MILSLRLTDFREHSEGGFKTIMPEGYIVIGENADDPGIVVAVFCWSSAQFAFQACDNDQGTPDSDLPPCREELFVSELPLKTCGHCLGNQGMHETDCCRPAGAEYQKSEP